MTTLYRPVQVTREGQREALPPGSFPHPDCREGGILTYLVPIEAEETRDEGTGWIVPTAFGPKLMGAYFGRPDDTPAKRYTQTIWRTHWTPTEEA